MFHLFLEEPPLIAGANGQIHRVKDILQSSPILCVNFDPAQFIVLGSFKQSKLLFRDFS